MGQTRHGLGVAPAAVKATGAGSPAAPAPAPKRNPTK